MHRIARGEGATFTESFVKETGKEERERFERISNMMLDLTERQYADRRSLGKGKAGEVWVGNLPEFEKDFAIKTVHTPAASVNHLDHEFAIHESFHDAGVRVPRPIMYMSREGPIPQQMMAMEALRGRNVEQLLDEMESEGRKFSLMELQSLLAGVKKEVATAHAAGLYHRDLHFRNVMVDENDNFANPYIIDFGDATLATPGGDEQDIYADDLAKNGRIVRTVFPRDEQFFTELRRVVAKRGLIEKSRPR